ncbi:hypothetical protein LTS15_002040 [Exophiala xenobiotica]|nr:hypothetical protein LTS15_002040 [Exophiala xenobiotica]
MPPSKGQSKRKATDLSVPDPGEDALERKRVLNVLAQRRYRQRQREHVQQLEAQTQSQTANAAESDKDPRTTLTHLHVPEPCAAQDGVHHQTLSVPNVQHGILKTPVLDGQVFHGDLSKSLFQHAQQLGGGDSNGAQTFLGIDPEDPFATFDENQFALEITDGNHDFFNSSDCVLVPSLLSPSTSETTRSSTSTSSSSSSASAFNSSTNWSLPPLVFTDPLEPEDQAPGTRMPKHGHARSQSRSQSQSPSSQRSQPHAQITSTSMQSWQQYESTTFPDESHLDMPELALLRGCMSIAHRLDVADLIWSLSSISPFCTTTTPTTTAMATSMANPSDRGLAFAHLPPNLRPTPAQLSIPHHPVIDLLPWPSVRDRLIHVLNQPPQFRPAGGAKSPMALIEFVYDIEDPGEGVRISGEDPLDGRNWEVGEKVFRGWWWCFDREVVSRTNELRRRRGAATLGVGMMGGSASGSGSVLGEVG